MCHKFVNRGTGAHMWKNTQDAIHKFPDCLFEGLGQPEGANWVSQVKMEVDAQLTQLVIYVVLKKKLH